MQFLETLARAGLPPSAPIEETRPPGVVLVHGELHEMQKLKTRINMRYRQVPGWQMVHMPPNNKPVVFRFESEKRVKALGSLVCRAPTLPCTQYDQR